MSKGRSIPVSRKDEHVPRNSCVGCYRMASVRQLVLDLITVYGGEFHKVIGFLL